MPGDEVLNAFRLNAGVYSEERPNEVVIGSSIGSNLPPDLLAAGLQLEQLQLHEQRLETAKGGPTLLQKLIAKHPPPEKPARTRGKIDAKGIISQLPAELLFWLKGLPGSEVNFRTPPPLNELSEAREARVACTRAFIASLGADPDDKPIYTKHRLIPTNYVNPYAKKSPDDAAGEAPPPAPADAGEGAGEGGAGEE